MSILQSVEVFKKIIKIVNYAYKFIKIAERIIIYKNSCLNKHCFTRKYSQIDINTAGSKNCSYPKD